MDLPLGVEVEPSCTCVITFGNANHRALHLSFYYLLFVYLHFTDIMGAILVFLFTTAG